MFTLARIGILLSYFRWFVGEPPKNLFVVNDDYDAAVSLFWAEQNLVKKEPCGEWSYTLHLYANCESCNQIVLATLSLVIPVGYSNGYERCRCLSARVCKV